VTRAGSPAFVAYTKFRYDRDILSKELGGRLRYSGGHVVLSGAF
jgi:hypothetical protein